MESVAKSVMEQKDIGLIKCSVIFYNLEESESEDVSERINFDKQIVLDICSDLDIDLNKNQTVKVNRLRKIKNSDKHILVRVQLTCYAEEVN